ncbi:MULTISPECIES: hypothetical protein [Spirosoma]|uniref:Uncharacterized protein n=1 Tax=Spirosoma liriopis TaxID=2937440 RepID=A0ABT0HR88_9BACT|nr:MULTISPECIES: hypothetical protein [Spirosoma]MCK8494684.1 hypothetical protein [Spirosoma liriopis]UHG93862.1 hypothetical protein LQ777_24140 [Spirosoma oryzicola]
MQRRYFPSILLYGFGLALALSLAFNGFLLYEQSHQRSIYEYELGNLSHSVDDVVWEQQLSECERANQQKDSLLRQLEQAPNAPPPGKAVVSQRTASK